MVKKSTEYKKILIVEDDALLVKILSETFISEKFNVETVENGLNVFDLTKRFSPDIILLDLIIPGLDGFAVLKKLKSSEVTRKIPVIILSNLGDAGDVKSGRALGAEEYFIKANVEISKIVDYVKNKLLI